MFTSSDCFFCPAAREILTDVLNEFEVSEHIPCEIDPHQQDVSVSSPIAMLPTIRICDRDIVGIPNEQDIRDSLLQAMSKYCFRISSSTQ